MSPVLDRIFDQMRERFRPDQAAGVQAEVRFVIADGDSDHFYGVRIADASCTVQREVNRGPRVTLTMPPFVKLVSPDGRKGRRSS